MRQLLTILGAAAVVALVAAGLAGALSGSVPAPPANPTSADQIQNIDQVKTAIKGYYGDTPTSQVDPVDNSVDGKDNALHQFSPTGAYANEMAGHRLRRREVPEQPARKREREEVLRHQGDPVRHRRHDAEHLQLRDLQQLRVQPGDERGVRQRLLTATGACSRPCRAWSTSSTSPSRRLHGVLPHRAAANPTTDQTPRHARQPDGRRLRRRPGQRLSQGRHRNVQPWLSRVRADLQHDAVQVAHPAAHRVARATTSSPTSATSSAT